MSRTERDNTALAAKMRRLERDMRAVMSKHVANKARVSGDERHVFVALNGNVHEVTHAAARSWSAKHLPDVLPIVSAEEATRLVRSGFTFHKCDEKNCCRGK